jgi:hypothetical protein
MPFSFEVELVYSYLEELGLPPQYNVDYIQNSYVGLGLSQKIDLLASDLLESLKNTIEDPDDFEKEHAELAEAYNAIVYVHFDGAYGRLWEYKTDGELLPEDLSERFKTILSMETDLLDMIKCTDNQLILELVYNADSEKIQYLNAQSTARIFVNCYENPHNWGFY